MASPKSFANNSAMSQDTPASSAPFDSEKQAAQAQAQLLPTLLASSTDETARGDGQAVKGKPLQRWNQCPTTMFRFFTTLYSFLVMGMNDGCIGSLIPYMETYYHISHSVVSLMFLVPFVGYLIASLLNNIMHHKFGQFGVAAVSPMFRLMAYIPIALHPPFPALPVLMLLPGLGSGLQDSAWNAWVGNMQNANELLGFLHGVYGLGATIAPLVATSMVAKAGLPWYSFFYVLIGMVVVEQILSTTAFWGATAEVHRATQLAAAGKGERTTTRRVLREPLVWLLAVFLLAYVGAEVSLGGWVVSFMLEVRGAEPFLAGLTVTFFWLGLTTGRVLLGFVTGRAGEKMAITGYIVLCLVLNLLYWLVPSITASIVFVTFLGFFAGPLFPAAIVAASKLLPVDFHVSAIGFAAAVGGAGGALLPWAVGIIAQTKGVQVLQPIVLALLVFMLLVWWLLPGGLVPGGLERARQNNEKVGHGMRQVLERLPCRKKEVEVPK